MLMVNVALLLYSVVSNTAYYLPYVYTFHIVRMAYNSRH